MDTLFWIIGIAGSVAFAVNLLPQVIKAYRTKSTDDISQTFIYLAYTGNVCSCIFVYYSNLKAGFWQYPLYFNYGTAFTLTVILHVLMRKYRHVKNDFFEEMYIKTIDKRS